MIAHRVPEKKGLDRRTDGQQSDPIRVPFYLLRYGTLKNIHNKITLFKMMFNREYACDLNLLEIILFRIIIDVVLYV